MYFPASAAIATSHSSLAKAIGELDRVIYQTGDHPLRVPTTADLIGIAPQVLERLLAQFEQSGLLRRETRRFCRDCDWALDEENDELWCDSCERTVLPRNAHHEEVFAVVDPIIRVDFDPEDTGSPDGPSVIQFIAGNRGGPQEAQIQSPREYRQIKESIRAAKYRDHLDLAQAIHAATVQEIATAYTASPDILHFAGHGNDRSLSVIRDRGALVQPRLLTTGDLCDILRNFPRRVRLCVFNTCDSGRLAIELVEAAVIDAGIGWDGKVDDNTAIDFATGFYRHLAEGLSLRHAFQLARASTERDSIDVLLHLVADLNPSSYFIVRGDAQK